MVGTDGIPGDADASGESDSASTLRRRHAEEIERLAAHHERQLDELKSSSRYQIGDALISAVRSPRRLGRSVRQLRSVFTNRSPKAPALGPLTPVDTPNSSVAIGAVLDEFSWSCFANEAALVELRPDTAAAEVEGLDLVLVESAWLGNRGQWSYLVNGASTLEPLKELVAACARHDVPAVFWNKEDPVGFDAFIDAARLFPAVLTTDAGSVERYRDVIGPSAVVESLPFAAQPRTHNPIGRPRQPLDRVCFAGAWRGDKYPGRARQIDDLMGPAHEMGVLDIYDRYADDPNRERLGFPAPYTGDVLGSLSYEQTVQAYRRYAAFLNVNSVTDSPTMFSRRVLEILACGTPVISTPSRGIDELLGDVVITADTAKASRLAVEEMISDRRARDHRGHRGYRLVHSTHTYRERLATILEVAGLDPVSTERPSVAVVCVSSRPDRLDAVVDTYEKQTYPNRRLVIVCHSDDHNLDAVHQRVAHLPGALVLTEPEERSVADGLNAAISIVDAEYVAVIDDGADYGPDYLGDMMLTFGYSDAHVVGKRSHFRHLESQDRSILRSAGHEFSYVTEVAAGTLVFGRDLASQRPFRSMPHGVEAGFVADVRAAGHRVFSSDRFNFVERRGRQLGPHSERQSDEDDLADAEPVGDGYTAEEFFV